MEFSEVILKRRSIRGYASPVPHEDLEKILNSARQAARSYVVESPEILQKVLSEGLPAGNAANAANAVVIVSTCVKGNVGFINGEPANEIGDGWSIYDLGLHDAYLILTAADLGYDTLIMGLRNGEALRRILGIPDNEDVLSVIAIGKGNKDPANPPRKPLEDTVKFF